MVTCSVTIPCYACGWWGSQQDLAHWNHNPKTCAPKDEGLRVTWFPSFQTIVWNLNLDQLIQFLFVFSCDLYSICFFAPQAWCPHEWLACWDPQRSSLKDQGVTALVGPSVRLPTCLATASGLLPSRCGGTHGPRLLWLLEIFSKCLVRTGYQALNNSTEKTKTTGSPGSGCMNN